MFVLTLRHYVFLFLAVIALIVAGVIIGFILSPPQIVRADSNTPVNECVLVSTWGKIEIARCYDEDRDREYYMNNQGLPMLPWND